MKDSRRYKTIEYCCIIKRLNSWKFVGAKAKDFFIRQEKKIKGSQNVHSDFLLINPDEKAFYEAGASIASDGQTSTQSPQSVHFSGSITYISGPSLIASCGHSGSHAPHKIHSSLIT